MLAALAGGGVIPRHDAPAGAASSPAIGARLEPSTEGVRAPAGSGSVPTSPLEVMRFTAAPITTGGSRVPQRGHRAGGEPGPAPAAVAAVPARDLTILTRGEAPASPARHARCHAHSIRAGPLT